MHAVGVLQKLLRRRIPALHEKRLVTLMAMVDSALRRRRLTLCELARGLMPNCSVRHRIKRADRLLGNRALQRERLSLYQMLCMLLVGHCPEPIILVDWSDVKADRSFVLLRATVWTHRFALPIYEEVHPIKRQASPRVERDFLCTLKLLLGDEVRPILVTDAGFRGPWFKQVERLGWHWVGRVRGRTYIQRQDGRWIGCRSLFARATGAPQELGILQMIRSRPVTGRMVLYRKSPQGRQKITRHGRRAQSKQSEQCARREREPWLLCASASLERKTALDLVNIYRTRMRIEQSFRTLKSHQFGFSFEDTQSQTAGRLQMLILIHALALLVLWIAGLIADRRALRPAYESNARRSRTTISIITLGWLALTEQAIHLTARDFTQAIGPPTDIPGDEPCVRI